MVVRGMRRQLGGASAGAGARAVEGLQTREEHSRKTADDREETQHQRQELLLMNRYTIHLGGLLGATN